jgi:hypothetical protein
MRQIYRYLFAAIAVFGLFAGLLSCNKDLGNYDYKTINAVDSINDIWDLRVQSGQTINLKPRLVLSEGNDLNDFTYTWYYREGGDDVDEGKWVVLQEGLELNVQAVDPIGTPATTYRLAFEMVNKTTGIAYRKVFSVRVESPYARGFAALVEHEDGFDIDMIAWTGGRLVPYRSILDNSGSNLPRDGVTPYDILTYDDRFAPNPYATEPGEYSVMILTDKYTTRINKDNYSWNPSYDVSNIVSKNSFLDKEYLQKGESVIATKMRYAYRGGGAIYMYHKQPDGEANWYYYCYYQALNLFSVKMNGIRTTDYKTAGERFNPSEHVATMTDGIMYFDTDNNRFMYGTFHPGYAYYSISSGNLMMSTWYAEPMPNEPDVIGTSPILYKFNEPNEGLLYMAPIASSSGVNARGYAITKQADGSYKYIEFGSTFAMQVWTASSTIRYRYAVIPAGTNIADFKFFAKPCIEENNYFLYYVTNDNKVMKIDLSTPAAVVTDITDQVLKGDGYDEITLFETTLGESNDLWNGARDASRAIAVGTYNSSLGKTKGGKLEFFVSNSTSGNLTLAKYPDEPAEVVGGAEGETYQIEMTWKDMGRVVGLNFKKR